MQRIRWGRVPVRLGGVSLALLMLVRGGHAQGFTTQDPVIHRIWVIGMDSSHVSDLAQVLDDSIGPRPSGSPAFHSAIDWLLAQYAQWGIQAHTEQYGTWRSWRRGITHIDLLSPRVRTLEGTMLAWSPGTRGRDLEAGVMILPDVADSNAFVRWLPNVRGKFVLASMAQPTCRPDDDWQAFATPASLARMRALRDSLAANWAGRIASTGYSLLRDRPLVIEEGTGSLGQRLEAAGAAGMLVNWWSGGWGTDRVYVSHNTIAPAIDLSCEDYGLVYRLAEHGQNPLVRLRADGEVGPDVPVFNTIAEIEGTELPTEYVVLSAHLDSFDAGSGATDNGTGTVMVMEAMRILRQVYPHPRRTIIAGHWGAEEQGLVGSMAYAADHPEVVNGLQALFNQDNGTGRVDHAEASALLDAGEHWARWLARVPEALSKRISLDIPGNPLRGGSDNSAFACHGAPAFSLGGVDWEYRPYTWHTNRDTYDKIVLDDLRSNATLLATLAYLASEDPERVPRTRREVMPLDRTGAPRTWMQCSPPIRSSEADDAAARP